MTDTTKRDVYDDPEGMAGELERQSKSCVRRSLYYEAGVMDTAAACIRELAERIAELEDQPTPAPEGEFDIDVARLDDETRALLGHVPMRPERPAHLGKWVIWSGEHGAFWRAEGKGYTDDHTQAGVFTRADAESRTSHCGREKRIEIREARFERAGQARATRTAWRPAQERRNGRGEDGPEHGAAGLDAGDKPTVADGREWLVGVGGVREKLEALASRLDWQAPCDCDSCYCGNADDAARMGDWRGDQTTLTELRAILAALPEEDSP